MRFRFIHASALLFAVAVEATQHNHGRLHHRRHHHRLDDVHSVEKRGGTCEFPSDAGLVAVTPNAKNAGWAMSPDQPCEPGSYCPYACPPGQVSMQWDPDATSYSYPMSMNGGLYCDKSGKIQKPFPDRPYCQDGTGSVRAVNKCSSVVSFCQTVLPGNEAMLIPTLVQDTATLAVPDPDYWCETAAHFYINPPGYDTETACVWGTSSNPYGNWSPYVAGANTDGDGNTFVKIGWNPIYLEPATPFRKTVPDFGVKIECDGCQGLPCAIDPAVNGVNEVTGNSAGGAGGGAFCVVTVPKGGKANIVVFEQSGGSGGNDDGDETEEEEEEQEEEEEEVETSTSAPSSTSTTAPSTTSSSFTTKTSTTAKETSESSTSTSTKTAVSTTAWLSGYPSSTPGWPDYTYKPHVLIETSGGKASAASTSGADSETAEPSSSPTSGASISSHYNMAVVALAAVAAAITGWSS